MSGFSIVALLNIGKWLPAALILLCLGCGREGEESELSTNDSRVFDASTGALSQPRLMLGAEMSTFDIVQNVGELGGGNLTLLSKNLENDEEKTPFTRSICILKELGINLPRSRNGIYWARWQDQNLFGLTLAWPASFGYEVRYSFLSQRYLEKLRVNDASSYKEFIQTIYHEIKGHNLDGSTHNDIKETDQFFNRYDKEIILKLQSRNYPIAFKKCFADG